MKNSFANERRTELARAIPSAGKESTKSMKREM